MQAGIALKRHERARLLPQCLAADDGNHERDDGAESRQEQVGSSSTMSL